MIQRCWAQVVQARPSIGEVASYFQSPNLWTPLLSSGSQTSRRKNPRPLPVIPYTQPSGSTGPPILPVKPGNPGSHVTIEARPLHTSSNDSVISSQPRFRQLISPDGSNILASHHSHLSCTGHNFGADSDQTGFSRITQPTTIPHPPVQHGQDSLHPEEKLRIWQLIETQFPTLRPEAKSHLQQLLEAPLLSRTEDRLSNSQDVFMRPPPEVVYDHLDEYFKDHDLDQPIIDASSEGTSCSFTSTDLSPSSVIQSPQGDVRSRHKKSIRVVVDEHNHRTRNRNSMLGHMLNAPEPSTTVVPERMLFHAYTVDNRSRTSLATFTWVRGELIGKGTHSRVYLALNATTGDMIAVKQVEIPQRSNDREDQRQVTIMEALKSESETLKDLDHPCIVQYLGFEETSMFLSM
jgi:hypothetical protein